jgi:septal ring factor EnvC (AmiA/AmiB activator)
MAYMSREVLELRRLLAEKDKTEDTLNCCLAMAEAEVSELRRRIQDASREQQLAERPIYDMYDKREAERMNGL